jgi:hypothetical protein
VCKDNKKVQWYNGIKVQGSKDLKKEGERARRGEI